MTMNWLGKVEVFARITKTSTYNKAYGTNETILRSPSPVFSFIYYLFIIGSKQTSLRIAFLWAPVGPNPSIMWPFSGKWGSTINLTILDPAFWFSVRRQNHVWTPTQSCEVKVVIAPSVTMVTQFSQFSYWAMCWHWDFDTQQLSPSFFNEWLSQNYSANTSNKSCERENIWRTYSAILIRRLYSAHSHTGSVTYTPALVHSSLTQRLIFVIVMNTCNRQCVILPLRPHDYWNCRRLLYSQRFTKKSTYVSCYRWFVTTLDI